MSLCRGTTYIKISVRSQFIRYNPSITTLTMNMKNVPLLSFALFFGFFGYALLMSLFGDPRLTDGALNNEELFLYEKLALALSMFGIAFSWIYAIYKALKRKQIKWFFLVFIVWPLAIVYIHKYD